MTSLKNDDGKIGYPVLIALFLIGMTILVHELFFDVASTTAFLKEFELMSRHGDRAKSQRRDRAPTGSTIWQTRTETVLISKLQALKRHYFDPSCNAPSNWLDTSVGALFVVWSVYMMTNGDTWQRRYNANLVRLWCFLRAPHFARCTHNPMRPAYACSVPHVPVIRVWF